MILRWLLLQGYECFGDRFSLAQGHSLILHPRMRAELAVLLADADLEFGGQAAARQHGLQGQRAAQAGHGVEVVGAGAVHGEGQ